MEKIIKVLDEFNFDSTAPNFINLVSTIELMLDYSKELLAIKDYIVFDSLQSEKINRINPNINFFFGIGFLQVLFLQQNCMIKIYKYLENQKLELSEDLMKVRSIRNTIAGHPDDKKVFPNTTNSDCGFSRFDESNDENFGILFEDIYIKQSTYFYAVLCEIKSNMINR